MSPVMGSGECIFPEDGAWVEFLFPRSMRATVNSTNGCPPSVGSTQAGCWGHRGECSVNSPPGREASLASTEANWFSLHPGPWGSLRSMLPTWTPDPPQRF